MPCCTNATDDQKDILQGRARRTPFLACCSLPSFTKLKKLLHAYNGAHLCRVYSDHLTPPPSVAASSKYLSGESCTLSEALSRDVPASSHLPITHTSSSSYACWHFLFYTKLKPSVSPVLPVHRSIVVADKLRGHAYVHTNIP